MFQTTRFGTNPECLKLATRGNMVKKTTSAKKCMYCSAKLSRPRGGSPRYSAQYCEKHWALVTRLRALRQPCRAIECKNPADEDGYCDPCRPFTADESPLRLDWLEGEGLIETNRPSCQYTGAKITNGTYRSNELTEKISKIYAALND